MKTDKYTICLLTDTLCDANGVSRFIADIADQAHAKNHSFYVLSSTNKTKCQKLKNATIFKPLVSMKMPFYKELDLVLPPFIKIYKELKKRNPDLIHISTPGTIGIVAFVSAKLLGKPIAGVYHTDFPAFLYANTKSKFVCTVSTWMLKRFYKRFSLIFARSKVYEDALKKDFGMSDVVSIQAGTDLKRFNPLYEDQSIWQKYGLDASHTKFLYVGRLTHEKNVAFLFDMWQEFFDRSERDVSLIVVGDGELSEQAHELKAFNVHFLGHKSGEELSQLYASCEYFLFASLTDTLGQVVMEAMASGTVPIVSNVGGPQSIIQEHKKYGYILDDTSDKELWIETLLTLQKKDARYDAIRHNCIEKMKTRSIEKSYEHFWESNIKLLEKIKEKQK